MSDQYAVLVIDDEIDALKSFELHFRKVATLLQASSGAQALDILRSYKDKEIAVVVVDQRMPEMTGLELMLQIQKEFPHIIKVLFTGYSDTKVLQSIVNQADIFRYIRKPYEIEEVRDILQASIQKYVDDKEKRRHLEHTMHSIQKSTARAMEGYTGWIAHHINNAMQSIHTFMDLALPRFDKDEAEKEFAKLTLSYARRVSDTIQIMQDIYSKAGFELFVKAPLSTLLEFENKQITEAATQKKIQIKKQVRDLEIMVDPVAIQEAIRRLVANSIEASPAGAVIEVSAAPHESDGYPAVMFEVKDHGCGIPAEIKNKLFFPFIKAGDGNKLRGLGLPYVQAVVARHGGDIHVDSVVGKGTSVSFSLPIIQPEKEESELDKKARELLKRNRR